MEYVTFGLVVLFTVLVGRNDGAPLAALALRSLHSRVWWPPIALLVALIALPAAGIDGVARTLAQLFRTSAGSSEVGLLILLLATVGTLTLSSMAGIPTSITLALVGAAAGAQLANGNVDLAPVFRVLSLAAVGPLVACLLAIIVAGILTRTRATRMERTVRWQQATGLIASALAYAANDGQKVVAVFAVLLHVDVRGVALHPVVLLAIVCCFGVGTIAGLSRSALSLRQGVLHPKPYQVAITLWSSAVAVTAGAFASAPVSMTQSVTGALIGSSPPREWRRIRWQQSRRVVLAWVWTLPIAGVLSWALTLTFSTVI